MTAGRRASLWCFHRSPQPSSPAAAQRPRQTPYSHLTKEKQTRWTQRLIVRLPLILSVLTGVQNKQFLENEEM